MKIVRICWEAEAAALNVRRTSATAKNLTAGQHFILVDMGHGTVDVSAAEIGEQPDTMKFISAPLGSFLAFFFLFLFLFFF